MDIQNMAYNKGYYSPLTLLISIGLSSLAFFDIGKRWISISAALATAWTVQDSTLLFLGYSLIFFYILLMNEYSKSYDNLIAVSILAGSAGCLLLFKSYMGLVLVAYAYATYKEAKNIQIVEQRLASELRKQENRDVRQDETIET